MAEFIRDNPPLDISDDHVHQALDILESPWPRREEIILRGWFESDVHQGAAPAGFLIKQILEAGLEPTAPPASAPN